MQADPEDKQDIDEILDLNDTAILCAGAIKDPVVKRDRSVTSVITISAGQLLLKQILLMQSWIR